MDESAITCEICGEALSTRQAFQYVEGWVRVHRAAGGTNSVTISRRHERFAHHTCLELKAKGLKDQTTLL